MTKTINIKAILAAWLIAAVIIVLLMAAGHYRSVSATTMQWQSDTSWAGGWNRF